MIADEARRLLLRRMVGGKSLAASSQAMAAIPRVEPASFAQRRLWFIEQLQQAEAPYTLHAVQHLRFGLDSRLLENALRQIVGRHEALRTTFEMQDDEVVQRIGQGVEFALNRADLRAIPEPNQIDEAKKLMSRSLALRFDLRRGPLLRVDLYQLGGEEFLMLLAVHHIVFDWQSFQVFFEELQKIYASEVEGCRAALPPPAEQYAAYAREQRERLNPARIEREVAFWRDELAGLPLLDLPLDRPRPRLPSFRGDQLMLQIPAPLVQQLQHIAAAAEATLFTVLLAGFAAALGRICRQRDFALGLPLTARDSPKRQSAIGFYVDTLLVRLRWSDDPSADELVKCTRDAMRRVLAHRQLPFDLLVQHLHTERDLGVNPLFQVGFQLMQQSMSQAQSYGTDPARQSAMFDLCIDLWPQASGDLRGRMQFNADIFDPATIAMVGQLFVAALRWFAAPGLHLSELSFDALPEPPALSLLAGEKIDFREETCLDLIADMGARRPGAVAVEHADGQLTYGALMERVESIAGRLAKCGLSREAIIVVELRRSLDLVLIQLALMRIGAAFACVDPEWPQERRDALCKRAAAPMIVNEANLPRLMKPSNAAPPSSRPARNGVAYVITTSGSSGEPKSVVIEHFGLLNVAHAQRRVFGLGDGRRVAQLSSPTFDASVFEMLLALCAGATLVIAPPGIVAGGALEDFLASKAIDTVVIPPSVLATAEPGRCQGLRLICVAGESCSADLAAKFGVGCEFWNLYGPTETTIWASFGRTTAGAKIAIGKPIPNLCTAVVDEAGRVLPVGLAGELCVAGSGVARGYLGQPELTARVFVPAMAPLAAAASAAGLACGRAYRTGDLVRQMRNGELVFLGRTDRQIKVRGLRIEPEEIEQCLREIPEVSEALVEAVEIGGDKVLVAYLQTRQNRPAALQACRDHLRARLPVYMCPSYFVDMAKIPRTTSGKIDRNALPLPVVGVDGLAGPAPPASETERLIAKLMQELLHRAQVGAEDDFFHIGGHSLAAARLAARLRASLGVEISIAEIFTHTTVSALAAHVDTKRAGPQDAPVEDVPLIALPRGQVMP